MSDKAIETLAWVLIYGGLLLASLGVFVWRGGGAGGGVAITVVGVAAAIAGAVLIWIRSRRGP